MGEIVMVDECKKIIKRAAKEQLEPLGFFQVGQTRRWVRDDGWYFTIADFSPTTNIPCAALHVYIKFLWGDSPDIDANISGIDYGKREKFRVNYEGDSENFYQSMLEFCDCAKEKASEYAQFRTLEYSDFIFEKCRHSPNFSESIIGPWQMSFWNCWHCAMYFYFRGRPNVGDELMQKFIEWRLRVDFVGISKKEEEKIQREYMKRPEYILGKKLLDLPENEKQPFVLARISEKRQLFRSKSSWKKLKENTTYG